MAIDARKMENVTISPVVICDDKELKEEYSKFCINRGMRYEFGTKIVCSKPKTGEKMVLCVMTIAWDDVEDFEAFCEEFDMQTAHIDD
mgnify:CR=1 FL=1